MGIKYGLTAAAFMLIGLTLVLLIRWQLAFPGRPVPGLERVFDASSDLMPNGAMTSGFYNSLGAMHGTIMVFLAVVPMLVGAFGNYLVPLQIGAPNVAFPRVNAVAYWGYLIGGLTFLASFLLPDGPANSGWSSYAPLAVTATAGQTFWLAGMIILVTSSSLGALNMLTTIVQLRAGGMTFWRMPLFVWSQLVASFLLLLAFPPLQAAAILQLSDRVLGTSFFLPSGLVVSGEPIAAAGGGSPLLWQHLFWFLAHPEVYVLVLPAMGIVAEVLTSNSRRPLWGYRSATVAVLAVGLMSFVVWAHHMFLTGMGSAMSAFFEITTMIISVPSVVLLTVFVASLWGGSIRFTMPMLFALAFIPMFGIGGLTGLPLGLAMSDIYLHDTTYVLGHFHYVVAPGTIFAIFAGIYHWFPKMTGKKLDSVLGHLHFWPTLLCMNGIFFPMLIQGFAGVSRRLYDGGATYAHAEPVLILNKFMSYSAFALAAVQTFFLVNLAWSLAKGQRATDNPWEATTLEWAAPSPPLAHCNFAAAPTVFRGPYEYSVPGRVSDFMPQHEGTVA